MRLQDIRVRDLMTTGVITIKESDTLRLADAEMKLADIRHLPVVDDHGHVVGILSNRDILRGFGTNRRARVSVAALMSTRVMTVPPNALARDAADMMLQYKIGALPVVGDEEELIGVITETDLLRAAWQKES